MKNFFDNMMHSAPLLTCRIHIAQMSHSFFYLQLLYIPLKEPYTNTKSLQSTFNSGSLGIMPKLACISTVVSTHTCSLNTKWKVSDDFSTSTYNSTSNRILYFALDHHLASSGNRLFLFLFCLYRDHSWEQKFAT